MRPSIISYCSIQDGTISALNQTDLAFNTDINDFLKESYQALDMNYPKYYKMDNLCKIALIAVEYLLKDLTIKIGCDNLALSFVNSDSSLDSDWKHQQLVNQNKKVSPSIFVYTLPNILIGELAIKHQWHGENLFILAPNFSLDSWLQKANQLFALNKAEYCLGGWVNVFENNYDAKLFLVQKEFNENALDIKTIKDEISIEK